MPPCVFISEALASLGYTRSEIEDSLGQAKYDDVFATYLLLGRKTTDVSAQRVKSIARCLRNESSTIFRYSKFLHFLPVNSLKAMAHDRVAHCRCATFHLKSVQAAVEVAAVEQAARYRVHRIEVFTEVFLLATRNLVDGPRLVVRLFVSVLP